MVPGGTAPPNATACGPCRAVGLGTATTGGRAAGHSGRVGQPGRTQTAQDGPLSGLYGLSSRNTTLTPSRARNGSDGLSTAFSWLLSPTAVRAKGGERTPLSWRGGERTDRYGIRRRNSYPFTTGGVKRNVR